MNIDGGMYNMYKKNTYLYVYAHIHTQHTHTQHTQHTHTHTTDFERTKTKQKPITSVTYRQYGDNQKHDSFQVKRSNGRFYRQKTVQ